MVAWQMCLMGVCVYDGLSWCVVVWCCDVVVVVWWEGRRVTNCRVERQRRQDTAHGFICA